MTFAHDGQHGGQLYAQAAKQGVTAEEALANWLDFSASIPPWQFSHSPHFNPLALLHYPDSSHRLLIDAIQTRFEVPPDSISICNGVSAAIHNLFAYLRPEHTVLYTPLFGEYETVARAFGSKIHPINRLDKTTFAPQSIKQLAQIPIPKNSVVVWVNPSTPDGHYTSLAALKPLLDVWRKQDCWVLLDESFLPFIGFEPGLSGRSLLGDWPRLIVLQSLTKFYACPGLRIGTVFAHPEFLAQWPQAHWPVSAVDQALLLQRMLEPGLTVQNVLLLTRLKSELIMGLNQALFVERVFPGRVNFVLVNTRIKASLIVQALAQNGILVRDCQSFGLGDFTLRVAVKDEASQCRLLSAWANLHAVV